MFKKFVFIPPALIAIIVGIATLVTAVDALSTGAKLKDTSGTIKASWTHTPQGTKVATDYPVVAFMRDQESLECTCHQRYCRVYEPSMNGDAIDIQIDPSAPSVCYDASHATGPGQWGFPLGLTLFMWGFAGVCLYTVSKRS